MALVIDPGSISAFINHFKLFHLFNEEDYNSLMWKQSEIVYFKFITENRYMLIHYMLADQAEINSF